MSTPMKSELANIAADHGIDLRDIIDPVALAVRLAASGVPVATASSLCGVNRTTLHRKIASLPESQMFTTDNTNGYTAEQLAALNAELNDRLAGIDRGTDEYHQITKAFSDEVAGR